MGMSNCGGRRAQELSLQHVSNILWAFASFLHLRRPMAHAFVAEVLRRLAAEPFNPQQLSNLLWSLCIAEARALTPLLARCPVPTCCSSPSNSPPACQTYQHFMSSEHLRLGSLDNNKEICTRLQGHSRF